jgi:uncharacterized protein (TIGR04255 family)
MSDAEPSPGVGTSIRRYRRPIVNQVIAKIDFASPIEIEPGGPPGLVLVTLKKKMPIVSQGEITTSEVRFTPKGTQVQQQTATQWTYAAPDRLTEVKISKYAVLITYQGAAYKDFEDLAATFRPCVEAIFRCFPDLQAKRIGLRYIDKLELKDDEPPWSTFFHETLGTKLPLDSRITGDLARDMRLLEYASAEGRLRIQFGQQGPDYPAPIKRSVFTLDWDASTDSLSTCDEIFSALDGFHKRINTLFEGVITKALRDRMGVLSGS